MSLFGLEHKEDFVGITNRMITPVESTVTLSVWIVKGCAKVGKTCYIDTERGVAEVQIVAIETVDGYTLEANANTETLITFAGFPKNVVVPWKSIVSTKGFTIEEYSRLPFEMIVDDTIRYNGECVLVGRIYQGTIRRDDRIKISNDKLDYETLVENIERLKEYYETMSYGEFCSLILYRVPENIRLQITEGSRVTVVLE